jgi:hypothetical protein
MVDCFLKVKNPECYLFSQFKKFQQCIFFEIYELCESGTRIGLTIRAAQSEPVGTRLSAPHYLIDVRDMDNMEVYRRYWINDGEDGAHPRINDPAEARARGFFLIDVFAY